MRVEGGGLKKTVGKPRWVMMMRMIGTFMRIVTFTTSGAEVGG